MAYVVLTQPPAQLTMTCFRVTEPLTLLHLHWGFVHLCRPAGTIQQYLLPASIHSILGSFSPIVFLFARQVLSLRKADRCVWLSHPLSFATAHLKGFLWWLLRASQTYAMQLCSIMSDQHLHNLYPSYSLRTNHVLFFSAREATWIIYTSKICLFCWSQWLLSLPSHLSFMMERVRKGCWLN